MSNNVVTYAAFAITLWGLSVILDKFALRHGSAIDVFYGRMLFTTICFIPLIIHKMLATKSTVFGLSKTATIYIAISVLVTNAGVLCYMKSLESGEASKVAPLTSSYPLVALLLAIIFLGEKLTWLKFAGTLFISLGVWCLTL